MEINTKLIQLLNNRNSDLNVEISFLNQLKNVNVNEVPSATKTIQQLTKKLQKRLRTKEDSVEGLRTALSESEFKMKTYLAMDRTNATLAKLGANKSVITGLDKLKENLEKEVFHVYNISETDLVEENE